MTPKAPLILLVSLLKFFCKIFAKSKTIEIQYSKQPDTKHYTSSYIIIFLDSENVRKLFEDSFYTNQWMRICMPAVLLTCRFIETNGTWKITGNFCFNKTDGPFPERLAPFKSNRTKPTTAGL